VALLPTRSYAKLIELERIPENVQTFTHTDIPQMGYLSNPV
jgi:hypothetical protein